MNLNNLENLKGEMKSLGFSAKLIDQVEKNMEANKPEFVLHDHIKADKGQVELSLHFKQSTQSEFYYLNKFDAQHNQAKPLEEGQKYMVITPDGDKNLVKNFDNVTQAISFFKSQTSDSELAMGKDPANKIELASMDKGNINYVDKAFQRTFTQPPLAQTFWVEKGKGYTAEQAANLIQGRAVYRDDLLTTNGVSYKAWMKLDTDRPRDRHNNLTLNQYHDPSYGFDLKQVLDKFNIKELEDPSKREKLEISLKNGNRPLVTLNRDGEEVKLRIEVAPRYSQINLFTDQGKSQMREQFLKAAEPSKDYSKAKATGKEQSHGIGI
jgi:hypothetical protein